VKRWGKRGKPLRSDGMAIVKTIEQQWLNNGTAIAQQWHSNCKKDSPKMAEQ
jgi:hypothetical protein